MAQKLITDVVPGDVILDGKGTTHVTKVQIGPGSCKTKVHINENDCYESFTTVRVQD